MSTPYAIVLTAVAAVTTTTGFIQGQEGQETKALIVKLGASKHSLLDGIAQAERGNASRDKAHKTRPLAISAKFELADGEFNRSVYVAQKGREQDPEHNTLVELGGDPSGSEWKPEVEVFEDKEHLVRSGGWLTVMQLTRLSLTEIIGKAAATQKGTVYSAIPVVKAGKAVVDVLLATPEGKSVTVSIDLQTGTPVE